jgi:hypothetical protein
MTAKEYQELRFFLGLEFLPHEALALGLGIKPADLAWKPDEQSDEEMIQLLESQ